MKKLEASLVWIIIAGLFYLLTHTGFQSNERPLVHSGQNQTQSAAN